MINEPEKRNRAEINSLMVEFNKTTKNNLDLLEEKIFEIKNLLQLMDEKMNKIKEMDKEITMTKKNKSSDNVIELTGTNKNTIIKRLMREGKSSKEIAKIMGISKAEVDIYINLRKKN